METVLFKYYHRSIILGDKSIWEIKDKNQQKKHNQCIAETHAYYLVWFYANECICILMNNNRNFDKINSGLFLDILKRKIHASASTFSRACLLEINHQSEHRLLGSCFGSSHSKELVPLGYRLSITTSLKDIIDDPSVPNLLSPKSILTDSRTLYQ